MLRVIVPTIPKYYWILRAFAYLFNIYWSEQQPVLIAGYGALDIELPPNFSFHSIAKDPYPKENWTDGLIELLKSIPDEYVIIMLEDYMLTRGVDHAAIRSLELYMHLHPDVLRMDLTADRLYAGGMKEVDHFGSLDIVETWLPTEYQMSLQAGIWNKELLLKVLKPGTSPWDVELFTSYQVPPEMRVLGTRQWPCRYINIFQGGNPTKLYHLEELDKNHLAFIRSQGWIE